ncbi:MAG: hypothetical protein Q4F17_05620 [Eubacteriales bacterium]|nr:hypothetical protein [Eubacteriales bacterium]
MGVYDDLVRQAYRNVNTIVETDLNIHKCSDHTIGFMILLEGEGPARVEYNGNGHNYQAVIDAIHDYYRVNSKVSGNETFPQSFQKAIEGFARFCSKGKTFQSVFNFISYQLYKEKEGSATFQIDCAAVLNLWSKTISENHEKLVAETPNLDSWLRETYDYLRNTYGIRWDSRGF